MSMMLVEALGRGIVKEGDYINYHPDYRECVLLETETGWNQKQTLKTEEFKYQFAGIIYGQVILVADGVTEPIFLRGMTGHKKGLDAMQRYGQECYSSKAFDAKGICLTEPVFRKLSEKLSKKKYGYLLGSPCVITYHNYTLFGIRRVNDGCVGGDVLCYSNSRDYDNYYSVRPAVILPSDIEIDGNNNLIPYKN